MTPVTESIKMSAMPNSLPLRTHEAADPADPIRTAVRFPLHLPVIVRTEQGEFDAVTVDVSSSGVLFSMPAGLPVGSALAWVMRLPASLLGTPGDVAVECAGRVIWSGRFEAGSHIGVVIDEYVLRDEVP